MSDILCRWLNEELRLSKAVDPTTFARDFSNGYLIGEVLHKYQLQNDFSMFMKKDTGLNNLTRVETTLRLLGISFDINTAQELIHRKQDVAARLLYQLYYSLEKKKKAEIMQPAANVGLHKKEHEIYSDLRGCRQKPNDIRTFNPATIVQVPKPPPYTSQLRLKRQQQQQCREQEVQTVQTEIAQFETRKKLLPYDLASLSSGQPSSGDFPVGGISQDFDVPGSRAKLTLQSNSKYIQDIRQRLEEKAVAREQKEKRQDRFLGEQRKAQEAQEEAQREEQLVKRLTRQTQQEQRLATQLLQIRVQKDVIRKNRLFREQQYQQRRERDFQEALEREAALAQQAKLERAEEIRKELESCNRIAAERAQGRFKKHSQTCKDILEQIVDLATKVGEYRLHTGNLIPEKSMREWKELLFSGLPLYEPVKCQQPGFEFSAPLDPVELEKLEILKNQDYEEYTNMVGEWAWPEEAGETKLPLTNNNILEHIVQRLRNIVHQPIMEPSPLSFPHFTIKACVLGRFCSGKTTCLGKLAEALIVPPGDDVVLDSGKPLDSSCSATPTSVDQAQGLTKEAVSYISLDEEKAQSVKSLSISNTQGLSKRGSTSSVTNEDSQGVPSKSASPCPGSSSWVYVDVPLPPELLESLCSHWDTLCDSYVNNLKTPMDQLRSLQSVIQLHLLNSREKYKHYMGRPDLKQQLVSHWQKDFNSIPDDIREDEDTKAELRLRLDELCERLWDISDKHKEEDENERAKLLGDGWLEEHSAVLVNHHSVLMQVELDHFRDTFRILKVYYLSMYREVLPELPFMLDSIPLLHHTDVKHQDESTEPAGTSVSRQMDNGADETKTKLHPDYHTENRVQAESGKLPHEKLISDYEEALTAITQLVSAETHQGETKEQERARTDNQEVKYKIHKEYAAALDHEGNSAKARIALVKGHGLVMVQSLQSRAAQTLSTMEKWFEAHYLAEMKSIDQLSQVVGHHIETGAKVQYELVMECTDFFFNGDCHIVASPPPHPCPRPLEKPTRSMPTVTQLESLHRQLCTVAPSGLMSSLNFLDLLKDIISVNMGRNTLPEPWMHKNEAQLLEIISLLVDAYELIDWRQFLLSAALPWPFPSLSQLLVVLQRFKAADTGDTGYVNEDQYLQTELWFSNESVQPVPEDPSEPLPYDRLANLRKFFFQLFADHSFSPPRLDYVYMLQYFAADPNPRQGFIRALSVVLGQQLKHSSPGHLVKSMPGIEEAAELSSSVLNGNYKEEDTPCASSGSLGEQEVSITALLAVTCHKVTQLRDSSSLPPGCLSQEEHTEQLEHVFRELGYKPGDCAPFSVLSQHPFIQGLMETTTQYQLVNIHGVLLANQDEITEG